MRVIADLHIHSRFSRATSKELNLKNLEKYAKVKGIGLLGTGDFTHPRWVEELKQELVEDGSGILKTKTGFPFVLQAEVSNIYSQDGKLRRIHNVLLAKNFEVIEQVNELLGKKGKLGSDGRPIFGSYPCYEMVEDLKKIDNDIEIIPAHCLIPDSLIHTQNGLKKIKHIKKKDYVLTHKGRFKKVEKTFRRKYLGEIIEIVPACLKKGTYFTPEHPIYSIKTYKFCKNVPHTICKPTCGYLKRGCKIKAFNDYNPSWHQVKDLEKGDIILYPRYNKTKDKPVIYLEDIVRGFKEGNHIKPKNVKQSVKNALIKNKIKVSKGFCRLIGYYLAEGYCTRDYIGFTFSENEINYASDVETLLKKSFGEFINIQTKKEKSKGISVIVHSKILRDFFSIFYTKKPFRSFSKSLPSWFIDLPTEKLKELLIGWWRGDMGYTCSLDLLNQFKTIFIKLGIIPSIDVISAESINKRRENKCNKIENRNIIAKHDIFHLHNLSFFTDCQRLNKLPEFKKFITKLDRRRGWIDEGYIYLPINKIIKKRYVGFVYNLEVKDDNSYLTENLAVHNCWTPWFSLFGSMSGFDRIEDCYKDQTKHIHALETGLSSDPAMNRRLSALDKFSLVSNSDLHSFWPWRIGREANIFEMKELSYVNIIKILKTRENFKATIEVDPRYGKYHYDGHRFCKVCMEPKDSLKANDICPKCGRKLTLGVLHRIEQLADREEGFKFEGSVPFYSLIPLSEILANITGSGIATKKVWVIYNSLIEKLGNELNVLLEAEEEELKKLVDEKIAKAIIDNREGKIFVQPGYDGEYGFPVFDEKVDKPKQLNLSEF